MENTSYVVDSYGVVHYVPQGMSLIEFIKSIMD